MSGRGRRGGTEGVERKGEREEGEWELLNFNSFHNKVYKTGSKGLNHKLWRNLILNHCKSL